MGERAVDVEKVRAQDTATALVSPALRIAEHAVSDAVAELLLEIDRLRRVCAEAYQFAGAFGAPALVLDNLHAAAEGRELPHDSFLPVSTDLESGRPESGRIPDLVRERVPGDGGPRSLEGTPEDELMRQIFGVGINDQPEPIGKSVVSFLRELAALRDKPADGAAAEIVDSFRVTARELLTRLGEK